MTDTDSPTDYNSDYMLNREYFSECFDESANTATSFKTYAPALFFIIVAGVCFSMEVETYLAWFALCLGVVELLSIFYKRSWWIARQMLSRAAGNKVKLRIDDQGIFTESTQHQQAILWSDITELKCTDKGFVVIHNSGSNYLSRSGLEDGAIALLVANR